MHNDNKQIDFELAIEEELILVKEKIQSKEEIIKKLGNILFEKGYVKETFTQAVLDRELVYPTGLKARVCGVAIPHTDTQHVIKPAVSIATLVDPIIFHGMGAPETEVPVEIIMMLSIHEPDLVVRILRKVISILENDQAMKNLRSAKSKTKIKTIILDHVRSLQEKTK